MEQQRQYAVGSRRHRTFIGLTLPASHVLREQAQARGWRLLNLWHCDYQPPKNVTLSGVLVDNLPDDVHIQHLRRATIPIVRVGQLPHPKDKNMPAVLPDIEAQGHLAAEHFHERGFKHVAYFGRKPWGFDGGILSRGLRKRAHALGMKFHLYRSVNMVAGEQSSEDTHTRRKREFMAWIQDLPKPVGLLASADWYAAVYCNRLYQNGFDVPDEVAVLSRDEKTEICETNFPTLSSISIDRESQIRTACELLEGMMNGGTCPKTPIMIPPKGVIERESTNVLATEDRTVAQALRYIWDHIDRDLSVQMIADEVGLSKRQLGRRFVQSLGRSVNKEMCRRRLLELKHLLRTTDLPIAELASHVGFHSTIYLHRAFREAFDQTPSQYRRKARQTDDGRA